VTEEKTVRTWIEIDRRALARNFAVFRKLLPAGCRLMAVAKSNAYGHGLYDYVPAVERLGVDWVGVDSVVEALTLRRIGIKAPILVLGHTLPARFADAARHGVSLTVSSFDSLSALGRSKLSRRAKIHVKIDTGLHRQGFLPEQIPELIETLARHRGRLSVEGLYTHFARAKDPFETAYTRDQIAHFEGAAAAFADAGHRPLRHACATGASFLHPEAHYDMVRVGIGLFGLWPSSKTAAELAGRYDLTPVLAWRTIVSEVKRLPKGAGIGYELSERLTRDSVVGVCPIGYWHGFPRSLSGKGEVLVRGRSARVLGSVTMDMIVIDLTGIPGAAPEDTVTLIGRDGREEISACDAANRAGQSYYEFLTRLNPLIRKIIR
jgi:alanine racemase